MPQSENKLGLIVLRHSRLAADSSITLLGRYFAFAGSVVLVGS
jgi:hypothetical protein